MKVLSSLQIKKVVYTYLQMHIILTNAILKANTNGLFEQFYIFNNLIYYDSNLKKNYKLKIKIDCDFIDKIELIPKLRKEFKRLKVNLKLQHAWNKSQSKYFIKSVSFFSWENCEL